MKPSKKRDVMRLLLEVFGREFNEEKQDSILDKMEKENLRIDTELFIQGEL